MVKITLTVDGMACSMCESHVNDAVRKSFDVKKVTSSHKSGKTEIISEIPIDKERIKSVLAETGYKVMGYSSEPYVKKGFSLFGKK